MCFSRVLFAKTFLANFIQASHEIALIFIVCLILHQLSAKPNTIKSHKKKKIIIIIQFQHFLLRKKTNIQHNYKSQLYIYFVRPQNYWEFHMSNQSFIIGHDIQHFWILFILTSKNRNQAWIDWIVVKMRKLGSALKWALLFKLAIDFLQNAYLTCYWSLQDCFGELHLE